MLRRILYGFAAGVLVAASASAQSSASFYMGSGSSWYDNIRGDFYSGAPSAAGFANNTSFQIWCVDNNHSAASTGSSNRYDVWVSQLNGNLSDTRANDATKYTKAAWLANNLGTGNEKDYQNAIWDVMNGSAANCYQNINGTCSTGGINTAFTAMNNGTSGFSTINKSEWYVITDQQADGSYCSQYFHNYCIRYDNYSGKQEFIARCQTAGTTCDGIVPPNEESSPTPEPATMSLLALGLAGMAGASLRRRKK